MACAAFGEFDGQQIIYPGMNSWSQALPLCCRRMFVLGVASLKRSSYMSYKFFSLRNKNSNVLQI